MDESMRIKAMRDMLRELDDQISESTNRFREACARADHAKSLSKDARTKSKGSLAQVAKRLRQEGSDELERVAKQAIRTVDQFVDEAERLKIIKEK